MENKIAFDIVKEMNEIRNQLSFSKRLGFFFGAGTSMALGIPGIIPLTSKVQEGLVNGYKQNLEKIVDDLKTENQDKPNIEDILNQIRLIRQITKEKPNKNYGGINGREAKALDTAICYKIYEALSNKEDELTANENNKLKVTERFFAWFNLLGIEYEKEIFTTNYDLIFEKALESLHLPYFDGFVGAYKPFFLPESLEAKDFKENPPLSWFRLWKMHGSLGWFWERNGEKQINKVIRLGVQAKEMNEIEDEQKELVIYPSREKYESSRKQPFISYFDRFKRFLSKGEGILVIGGYSFGDEHINEIIFNGLRQNNRLHAIAFLYKDEELEKVKDQALLNLNMSAFSPKKGIISGELGYWQLDTNVEENIISTFWESQTKSLKLGDFRDLVDFLVASSGKRQIIDESVEGRNEE
jgi:hypothetical protein